MIDAKEILSRDLPKWPQMLVTGEPMSVEQAKEVIRRTDSFFRGYDRGNNHKFNAAVRKMLGVPSDRDRSREEVEKDGFWRKHWAEVEAFKVRWGLVETEYVRNDWIACSFVWGPHGWCHPDGQIGFIDNVGKWPSVEAVYEDWVKIAEAFPFIDVGVTLMDRERLEEGQQKVASLRVFCGKVEVVDPIEADVHAGHPPAYRRDGLASDENFSTSFDSRNEFGIPMEWIDEWARKHNPDYERVCKELEVAAKEILNKRGAW